MATSKGGATAAPRAPKVRVSNGKATAARTPKTPATKAEKAVAQTSTGPAVDKSVLDQYRIHPAASDFPMMADDELRKMADDIAANGQAEPVTMHDDEVLDGRNRLVACHLAGVQPRFEEWQPRNPGDSPVAWIFSKNLPRRHLSASQRAALAVTIAARIREESDRLRAEDRARREEDRARRRQRQTLFSNADAAVDRPINRSDTGQATPFAPPAQRAGSAEPSGNTEAAQEPPTGRKAYGRARDMAAEIADVSPAYVNDATALAEDNPALFARMASGELSLPKAQEELVRQAVEAGTVDKLKTRRGVLDQMLERIQGPQKKADAAGKPRISVRSKSGKVTSSRVTVTITATFGNPDVADEILNSLNDNPKVLDLAFDVVADPKKATGRKQPAGARA